MKSWALISGFDRPSRASRASEETSSGFADPAAFGDPISLALAYIGLVGLRNSRAEKPLLFPLWISDIVGAADLLLAMVLGSVLLLGRRSGWRSGAIHQASAADVGRPR